MHMNPFQNAIIETVMMFMEVVWKLFLKHLPYDMVYA